MNVAWDKVDFRIPAEGRRVRVIGIVERGPRRPASTDRGDSRAGTAWRVADPVTRPAQDRRDRAPPGLRRRWARGSWRDSASARGALASSVAHDHHNIIVVGADDESMQTAARRVAALHGGWVVADGAQVVAEVPLPIAGLMSGEPLPARAAAGRCRARGGARGSGRAVPAPFMAISFLGLEVIPSLEADGQGARGRRAVRNRAACGCRERGARP